MKLPIIMATCLLFAAVAVTLAGCGSHDQNSPSAASGSQGTPPEIIQNAKNQAQDMKNHPPPNAQMQPGH